MTDRPTRRPEPPAGYAWIHVNAAPPHGGWRLFPTVAEETTMACAARFLTDLAQEFRDARTTNHPEGESHDG
jgi:hypothetical protein